MKQLKGVLFSRLILWAFLPLMLAGCRQEAPGTRAENTLDYATGFTIAKHSETFTEVIVHTPWPEASTLLKYAFIDRTATIPDSLNTDTYKAVIRTPVRSLIATSTTHIPALEALGVLDRLKGFPDTRYISSAKARSRIDNHAIKDIGQNETMNTEMVLEMHPELILGFSINEENRSYAVLERSGIPVLYNGDWVEQHPLGKAEWVKLYGVMFGKEAVADSIFNAIATQYENTRALAQKAKRTPTVYSGAMFRDIWYLPAGESWAAQFLKDANSDYLWKDTSGTGSLSLSFESVLEKAGEADVWLGAAQFTSYPQLIKANEHYARFKAFKDRRVYTYSKTTGDAGGVLFYELAPQRPDLVLKDMIHILHPELLPDYEPVFYKPLDTLED
ncbi:ABC transporter substrate-binding protein [Robertkochia sp. 1368]|nr:ABC transporter substrate-binding protein [Robertkochia sediminum]